MKMFSSKYDYGTHYKQKIHIIFSKCDNAIENIQIHISWWIFFFFFGFEILHKCEK
jgi:hypothetical protein